MVCEVKLDTVVLFVIQSAFGTVTVGTEYVTSRLVNVYVTVSSSAVLVVFRSVSIVTYKPQSHVVIIFVLSVRKTLTVLKFVQCLPARNVV